MSCHARDDPPVPPLRPPGALPHLPADGRGRRRRDRRCTATLTCSAHVYAGPYPVADPGLTFVVVDELGLGAATSWRPPTPPGSSSGSSGRGGRRCARGTRCGRTRATAPRTTCWSAASTSGRRRRRPGRPVPRAHAHRPAAPRAGPGARAPADRDAGGRRCASAACPACTSVSTSRNEGAIAFYDRVGFTVAARHDWGTDADARPHVTGLAPAARPVQAEHPVDVRRRVAPGSVDDVPQRAPAGPSGEPAGRAAALRGVRNRLAR